MSDAQRPDPDCTSDCSQCGSRFTCGFAAGQSRCWCFDDPVVAVHDEAAGCVCPKCLASRVAERSHLAPAR